MFEMDLRERRGRAIDIYCRVEREKMAFVFLILIRVPLQSEHSNQSTSGIGFDADLTVDGLFAV
jgi:hypothetical protein